MKKGAITILAVVLTVALLLGACSGNKEAENSPQASNGADAKPAAERVTPAGQFPITPEKTTLRVMVKGSSIVENYATNEYTKWLEEKTNVHLEWEVAPEATFQEKLNVSLASGDYPDVLIGMDVSAVQQSIYGKDGVFLPLNDMIEKYGVETKRMFEEIPYAKDLITLPDGKIYGLPEINDCFHCSLGQKMWINKVWLDKLGLKVPETTEDFYQVLKAFKEQDPNGNHKADEIPLVGATTGPSTSLDLFIMSAFVEKDFKLMYVKDGKVHVSYNEQGWKDGLEYLAKLYREGLIAPQTFTQDRNQLKQMGMNPEISILGAIASQNNTVYMDIQSERFDDYVALPPLLGPSGVRSTAYNPFALKQGEFVITDKTKNPEAAFRLADLMYTEEATLRSTIGRPGSEWEVPEKGVTGLDGKTQATWRQITVFGQLQNVHWAQRGPNLRTNDYRLNRQAADNPKSLETILYNETLKYEPYALDKSKVVPPLFFTDEQSEELATIEKTINDYRNEFFAKSVTNNIDIDKEWDGYLSNLEKMKLPRMLQIYQEAYDIYTANHK